MAIPTFDDLVEQTKTVTTEAGVIEYVVVICVAVIVGAIVGNLLIKLAVGKASMGLKLENRELAERRATHAANKQANALLAEGRRDDIVILEGRHA